MPVSLFVCLLFLIAWHQYFKFKQPIIIRLKSEALLQLLSSYAHNNMSARQTYESDAIKVSYAGGPVSESNSISRLKERVECLPEAAEVSLLCYQGCKS